MNKKQTFYGFTLIELLIVIALLGFLSITGLSLFQGSQKRARDSRRKTDLWQVTKALEMYANDYGYPKSTVGGVESGKIIGCGGGSTACEWGSTWSRETVYMQKLPKDPGAVSYCYQVVSNGYKLFAKLEDADDADVTSGTCNSMPYNYVIRSSNLLPTQ